jgi:hypothetical protein
MRLAKLNSRLLAKSREKKKAKKALFEKERRKLSRNEG